MIHLHGLADPGIEAILVIADALGDLLAAGRESEVGCRPTHIVDIALEIRLLRKRLALPYDALLGSGPDLPSLMIGNGTKRTPAEAPSGAHNGELDFPESRNAAFTVIRRMPLILKGKRIYVIKLSLLKWWLWRILHHVLIAGILLYKSFGRHGIHVIMLKFEAVSVGLLGIYDLLKIRKFYSILRQNIGQALLPCPVAGTADPGNLTDVDATLQGLRDLQDGMLTHAVDEKVCPGIQEHRTSHLVRPVIVVAHPAKRRLQTAYYNGHILVCLPGTVGIDDDRPIRPPSRLSPRRIFIHPTSMLKNRVVVNHGIHHTGIDEETKPGPTESLEIFRRLMIRLRQYRHPIAVALQKPPNYGRTKRMVVAIRIPRDDHEVHLIPSSLIHFFLCDGQKHIKYILSLIVFRSK